MPDGLILPPGLRLSGGGRRTLIPGDPINHGLCLYAPLDEPAGLTAYDLSPWQRHGTLTNVVPSATVGWQNTTRGRALALDGSDDYVSIPQGHFPSGNQPYSFSGWVYWAASGSTRKIITWGRTGVTRGGVYIGLTSNRLDVSHWAEDWTSTISAPVAQWFHFGVTYNGTQDKVFLNGQFAEAKTLGGVLAVDTSLNNAAIGFLFNLNIEYFNGAFRHFRVYNRELLPGEMWRLYADPEAGSLSPEERIWVVVPPSGPAAVEGAGSAAGSATASGVGASLGLGAGSAAGTGAASAAGVVVAAGAGSATGAATAAGIGAAPALGVGTAAGTGAAAGVGLVLGSGAGSASGAGTAAASGAAVLPAAGSASGAATASAAGLTIAAGFGSAPGSATAAAVGQALGIAAGAAAGVATVAAIGTDANLAPTPAPAERTITWRRQSRTAAWREESRVVAWPYRSRTVTWRQ
jgi:hypothetical protein